MDSSVASSGDGSPAAPFKTIQEGISSLSPGEVLQIRGSASGRVYAENISFPAAGTEGAPITISGFPGEKVIISHSATIAFNRDYFLFQDLVFDHQNAASDALKVTADHVTFHRIEARNGKRDGFEIAGTANYTIISESEIHDFKIIPRVDAHCIVTNPGTGSHLFVMHSKIYNCAGDCIQFYGNGEDPSRYFREVLMYGNTMYTTLGADSENAIDSKGLVNGIFRLNDIYGFTHNKALVFQKGSKNIVVTENYIHDSERGIEVRHEDGHSPSDWEITRNVFANISRLGSSSYAIKTDGVTDALIAHNTLVNIEGNAIRNELVGLTNGVIRNNLIFSAGTPSIKGTWNNVTFSNNGWFNALPGALSGTGDVTGSDPLLGGDFSLLPGSPAIDRGFNLGAPFIGAAPDLGAKER